MIRQYAYFAIDSYTVSAADVTARLLIEPDDHRVRGSRRGIPYEQLIPVTHGWSVRCAEPGFTVGEQVDGVLERLRPYEAELVGYLAELRAAGHEVETRLQVVRYFDDAEDGEQDDGGETAIDGEPAHRLGGQHQLLGWHLGRRTLDFLQATGAELDVDEYG